MKQGRSRTLSICVSDIPKDRILKHENGKMYMNLSTWDYDEEDRYGNDFSISMSPEVVLKDENGNTFTLDPEKHEGLAEFLNENL